jgi:hypothetical protein
MGSFENFQLKISDIALVFGANSCFTFALVAAGTAARTDGAVWRIGIIVAARAFFL